jgi:TonB-linked SusC/RagA family outer membrane protein
MVALTMQFSFAQEKTITGLVSDSSGPLPGVNVVVKGTQRGVSAGFDGRYSIKAKVGEQLVYSFLGYPDVTRTVGSENTINVSLQEAPIKLGDVVVTGAVGIKKRVDAQTSSTQVVKAKEIVQANNPNIIQALSGKVAGLQINNTGNGVKSGSKITLRANRSITGNNDALIIIDGAISTAGFLGTLPPESIESVNVLKGAQGAALYGADGVNGVLIVSTKKGGKGDKMKVTITSSIDFEDVNFVAQRQTRYGQGWSGGHVTYENGAWGAEYDGSIKSIGLAQADGSYITGPYSPIKDNIKKFFKTGTVFQNGISIGGGNLENGYVNFSANKQNSDFVVDGDKLDRATFAVKGGKKIGKFTVEGNVSYITEATTNTTETLLSQLYQAATNIPVEKFKDSGNEGTWTSYYNNPYWLSKNIRFNDRSDVVNAIVNLDYDITKDINLSYLGNVRFSQANDDYHRNGYVDNIRAGGGNHTTLSQFDQSNSSRRFYYGDLMLNFDYKLTDDISLKLNLGNNIQDNYFKVTTQGGDNLTVPNFYNISNITGTPRFDTNNGVAAYNGEKFGLANGYTLNRSFGLFANLDLGYKEFLYLNATVRRDTDSRLAQTAQKSYIYPSAGISFIPTKLEGLKDNSFLSYAKIAASYVKTGNASAIALYGTNQRFASGTGFPFGNLSSFGQLTTITSNEIKPEFVATSEITGSFAFLKDRITLDASYYNTVSTDLITSQSASFSSGLTSLTDNIGQMTTKGYEIELGISPFKGPFKWDNRISYSTAKSIIDKVSDEADFTSLGDLTGGEVGIYAVEGEEFPQIRGVGYQRDPSGRVIIDATTGTPLRTSEFIKLGKSTPDYILNYNTSIEYKGFRLGVTLDYRTGHQFYSGTKDWLAWSGHLYESAINGRTGFIYPNSAIETAPGVYAANTNVVTAGNTYGQFLSYFQDQYAEIAENFVLDATALKIREISLGYAVPKDMLKNLSIESVRFNVSARNPFIFLAKENRGYSDPEFSATSGAVARGFNGNAVGISPIGKYPQTSTIGFSVNVTF